MKTSKWLRVFGLTAVIGLASGCGDDYGTPKPDGGSDGGAADGGKKALDGGSTDGGAAVRDGGVASDFADVPPSALDSASDSPGAAPDAGSGESGRAVDAPGGETGKDGKATSVIDAAAIDGGGEAGDVDSAIDGGSRSDQAGPGEGGAGSTLDSAIDGVVTS